MTLKKVKDPKEQTLKDEFATMFLEQVSYELFLKFSSKFDQHNSETGTAVKLDISSVLGEVNGEKLKHDSEISTIDYLLHLSAFANLLFGYLESNPKLAEPLMSELGLTTGDFKVAKRFFMKIKNFTTTEKIKNHFIGAENEQDHANDDGGE